ncbi:flagellar filament capping protein FliD [Paracoccaceae bacterium]|nr:flagellar filament capping protein FliD [Paracoccaceae bacterium]
MAVDYLSAINKQGSGLNVTQIVDSLVQAETAPIESRIQRQIDEKNSAISAYGLLAGELGKLKDFASSSKGSTAFTVSSNNTAVGVSVTDPTKAKAFNANISVSSLASSQTLEFAGFSSKTASINTGSINIDFGTWGSSGFSVNSAKAAQNIQVNSANNNLNSLADALNSIAGVNAAVTDKGDGTFSLIVNSDTGAKNALRMTVSEVSGDAGLAQFDTTSTNSSKQVVAAADATINLNGVDITRSSNVVSDLFDGYEFRLNSTTSTAATVQSNTDSNVAYAKTKEFIDMFNGVYSTLNALTKRGTDGEESGALSRDLTASTIKRKLRSLVSSELPGFGSSGRYLSELGIRTERDGSLSLAEADFKKAFEREPILFDVMLNSMASSDNPLVTVSHESDILQPKGGVYNFVGESGGNPATLNGVTLSGSTLTDGTNIYTATTGDGMGLRFQVSGSVSSATVFYGESFFSKLESYIKDVVSSTGVLAKSETQASTSISEFNDDKVDLEAKIEAIRQRYMTQFSAMESAVTGFKKTGEFLTGFIDSLSPDK